MIANNNNMYQPIFDDPRTKRNIKDALYAALYGPVKERTDDSLKRLVIKNTALGKYTHKSLLYEGVLYNFETSAPPRRMNRLLPSLQPEMDAYLAEIDEINKVEMPKVLGFINQVLNSTNSLPDCLKIFPDVLHEAINGLIAACNCRVDKLTEIQIADLRGRNQEAFELLKERMLMNMLT